jgi:hypothetical protein
MSERSLNVAVEGFPDEAVATRLTEKLGVPSVEIYVKHGKGNLDKSLGAYNAAARFSTWLVLRDLDHDAPCPGALRDTLLPQRSPHMIFRIAVRAVESWLMADARNFAKFLSIPLELVPANPESLEDPKNAVINLARRSKKRDIREDMVPRQGSGAVEGPAYASRLAEFALFHWQLAAASAHSGSLSRCIERLKAIAGPG